MTWPAVRGSVPCRRQQQFLGAPPLRAVPGKTWFRVTRGSDTDKYLGLDIPLKTAGLNKSQEVPVMTDGTARESGDRSMSGTALDIEADRLHREGRLRMFDTTDGMVLLGHIQFGGDRPHVVILGEIEGSPEGMTRCFAPEHPKGPFRGTFFLRGEPPTDWGWVAWADKVPSQVCDLPIPYSLRVKIATAAGAADTLIELSELLGQLTDEIDAEITYMANANTPEGDDSADLLAALLYQLTEPLDERLHHIAVHIDTVAGFAVIEHDRPSDLDGTPWDDASAQPTDEPAPA